MKTLWWRIVGEAWALLWGYERWWKDRPLHRCPECGQWEPRFHEHPGPPDPEQTRIGLLQCMNYLPDFGREILGYLRDEPEFAEFVAKNIGVPEPPRRSTPKGTLRIHMPRLPLGPMPLKNDQPVTEEPPISKRLRRRIEGEVRAIGWGLQCWWKDRPILYCAECEKWDGGRHEHDSPPDPEQMRRDLLMCMRLDPDFGPEMLRCLRGMPEFAEFVAQNIRLPDPPPNEDPLAIFRPKPIPGALAARVSETLGS